MRNLRTTPCRACRRPIHFVKILASGSWMPCEVEEVMISPNGEGPVETFITPEGETKRGVRVESRLRGDMFSGYYPHWQRCPNFRNRQK